MRLQLVVALLFPSLLCFTSSSSLSTTYSKDYNKLQQLVNVAQIITTKSMKNFRVKQFVPSSLMRSTSSGGHYYHAAFLTHHQQRNGQPSIIKQQQQSLSLLRSPHYSRQTVPNPSQCNKHNIIICCHASTTSTSNTKSTTTNEKENDVLYNELQSVMKLVQYHDKLYYTPGLQPELSDEEYDALVQREVDLYKQVQPQLLQDDDDKIRNHRVGLIYNTSDTNTKNAKLEHLPEMPMQSLDNANTESQVVKWMNRIRKTLLQDTNATNTTIDILAEPKMDGLSLSLRYQLITSSSDKAEYTLQWGATRGDGTKGENVTNAIDNILLQNNNNNNNNKGWIPKSFTIPNDVSNNLPKIIEVRGEIILPKSKFYKLNNNKEEGDNDETKEGQSTDKEEITNQTALLFSNARNAASGILLRRTTKANNSTQQQELNKETQQLRSFLQFYAYSIAFDTTSGSTYNYQNGIQLRDLLQQIGFTVPNPSLVTSVTIQQENEFTELNVQDLLNYHERIMSTRTSTTVESNNEIDFDVDGAVYKISCVKQRNILGSSTRAPKWAIAHKFPAQVAVTKLLDVQIQIGRTGALTPVAILDPVVLGGVKITRASLHNFMYAQSVLLPPTARPRDDAAASSTTVSLENDDSSNNKVVGVHNGTMVLISRAGDVIPQVLKRLDDDDDESDSTSESRTCCSVNDTSFISLLPPSRCPACGSKTGFDVINNGRNISNKNQTTTTTSSDTDSDNESLSIIPSSASMGQVLRCIGPQLLCEPRAVCALAHAFSRDALDISGLSEARLQQLMDADLIRVPSDIFNLIDSDNKNDSMEKIQQIPGWGEKSCKNLQNAAQSLATNGVSLSRFIYSLGIRHVGLHSSKLIASSYGTASAFINALEEAALLLDNDDTNSNVPFVKLVGTSGENSNNNDGVKGIGPVAIQSLVTFSKNDMLVKAARELASNFPISDDTTGSVNKIPEGEGKKKLLPFNEKVVVFTGTLPMKMARSTAQDLAIDVLGAKSTPKSISKSTDILVEGSRAGGKKLEKALQFGVQVMSADDFFILIDKHS